MFKLFAGETREEITIRGGASFDSAGIFVPIKRGKTAKTERVKVITTSAMHRKILNDARKTLAVGTIHDFCLTAAFTFDNGVISIEEADFETISIVPKFSIERTLYRIASISSSKLSYDSVDSLVISTFGIETCYIALDNFEIGFEFHSKEVDLWVKPKDPVDAHIAAIQFIEEIKKQAYINGFSIGSRLIAPKSESPLVASMCEQAIAVLIASAPVRPKVRTL